MKKITILLSVFMLLTLAAFVAPPKNFFSFKAKDIIGQDISLSQYKGKVILVVNLATQCAFTPQYRDLQALYEQYGEHGFVILGFPSNSFGGQEAGTNEEIKQFCTQKFAITFPMFSKISVTGDDIHPIYKFLTQKSENGKINAPVEWNFQKFLIDRDGNLVKSYKSKVKPFNKDLTKEIEKLLNKGAK